MEVNWDAIANGLAVRRNRREAGKAKFRLQGDPVQMNTNASQGLACEGVQLGVSPSAVNAVRRLSPVSTCADFSPPVHQPLPQQKWKCRHAARVGPGVSSMANIIPSTAGRIDRDPICVIFVRLVARS